ncbi:hypothetical protein AAG906_018577 [Vitis piasezkii]
MTKITGCSKSDEARRNLLNYALQGNWDEAMKITPGGDTALHIAVWDCKESWVVAKMVKLVRDHPQQYEGVLKSKDEQGNTPLHLAATIGNVSMCKCITREPNDLVSIGNKDGENPIFLAARHGKIEAFLCLLCKASESDPDSYIYRRNKKGEIILHCAIAGGHFKLAFLIIQRYKDLCNTLCECLARLAIPNKIPKCPLTRLSNSSSDHLTLKTKTLLRGQVCSEDEGEKLKVKVLVKWSEKD